MSSVNIDQGVFFKRVKSIVSQLKSEKFQNADVLLVSLGNPTDVTVYQKSTAVFSWLLGYEFPETVMVVTPNKVAFLASHKKVQILDSLKLHNGDLEIVTIGREKESGKSSQQFETLWNVMKEATAGSKVKVGILPKDKNEGPMVQEWMEYLKERTNDMESIDVAPGLSSVLAVKDENEVKTVTLAAKTSSVAMKDHLLEKILAVVDAEKKVTHSKLSEEVEDFITGQLKKFRSKLPSTLNLDYVDICYPPIIQSGGVYSLKPSALSNDDNLHFGVILCSLGVRYKSYCSNIGRTFLIDPTKTQEENLSFLLEFQKYLLGEMKPGMTVSAVYERGCEYVKSKKPELTAHLPNNFGFGMGLEFRESEFVINAKNSNVLKSGMVFNLVLGFNDINNSEAKAEKSKIYSLLIADTIEVTESGAQCLTSELKSLSQISYSFKSEQEQRESRKTRAAQVMEATTTGTRNKARTQQKVDEAAEKKRREHQKELAKIRLQEAKETYTTDGQNRNKDESQSVQKFESYKKEAAWPKEIKPLKVYVDKKNDTVILPVNGIPVPFHISTIKNATKNEEGKFIFLRINFVTPGRVFGRKENTIFLDPSAHFVRSLTVRSSDAYHIQEVLKDILDTRKQYTAKEAAKKEMSDLVHQDNLIEITGRRPVRLPDVYVRPGLDGKRLPGDVEIHSNGIRYKTQLKSDQRIDILFSNVKHLFFQPCDNEMIVLIHIHLKSPIMVGKKKTKDIQFYREALESHVDETGGRRKRTNYGDEDEIAQEREERRKREEANNEFKSFAEKISDHSRDIEVEVPFRELGFNGVPSRQTVLLQPTTECLVFLSEPPFTVITLNEVEIAYLERVMFGLKNFDLVFIFKDHTRAPVHINSIPMTSLEAVKDWLDSVDVLFAESTVNYNWTNIMKTVNEDPVGFYEMGGWSYLQPDNDGQEDSEEEEQSSEYEPESEEEEEFEEDDDDEYSDEDDDEDEYSEEDDDEEDDDAPDWDELEEEAKKEDARREKLAAAPPKRKAPQPPPKPGKRR